MLLCLAALMSAMYCIDALPPLELRRSFKGTAVYKQFEIGHLRRKRQNLEQAASNRCYSPTYNAIYPYRNYPFYYTGSEYYAGPYLERPFVGSTGQIYECPLSYCLHRNTGYLQGLFNRMQMSQLHQQFPPV